MKWQTTHNARMMPLALTGLLLAGQSTAADTPVQQPEQAVLQQQADSDQTKDLQPRRAPLERRDTALRTEGSASSRLMDMAQAGPAAPPKPAEAQNGGGTSGTRAKPGAFEVDEEAAQRALERTLTQSGALLLPPRTIELTPSYSYRRTELTNQIPVTITTPPSGSSLVLANQRNRRNENGVRLDVRAGMPYSMQVEVSLPYNYARTSQVTDLGTATSDNGKGIGDATLGVAKTLTRERGWKPDLIGRLTYNFGNGKRQDGNVALNGGYRQLQAELVAIKRQDPLAFVASAFYGKAFEKDAIKPGDATGFSLAAILAASPATSLQLGFSQIYRTRQELNGVRVAGSDQTYGIVSLGASSVLSRDMTLVTQVGIGLGNDAPKYSFTISLPILFR